MSCSLSNFGGASSVEPPNFPRLPVPPPETAVASILRPDRPVDEERLSNHTFTREISPRPRIGAVDRVVAHDHVMVRPHGLLRLGCREQRSQPPLVKILGGDRIVQVARKLTVLRWLGRIK